MLAKLSSDAECSSSAVQQMANAPHAMIGILHGHAADDAVDLVAFFQQQFGQVGAVLPGDAGDQCGFHYSTFGSMVRAFSCPSPLYSGERGWG